MNRGDATGNGFPSRVNKEVPGTIDVVPHDPKLARCSATSQDSIFSATSQDSIFPLGTQSCESLPMLASLSSDQLFRDIAIAGKEAQSTRHTRFCEARQRLEKMLKGN